MCKCKKGKELCAVNREFWETYGGTYLDVMESLSQEIWTKGKRDNEIFHREGTAGEGPEAVTSLMFLRK